MVVENIAVFGGTGDVVLFQMFMLLLLGGMAYLGNIFYRQTDKKKQFRWFATSLFLASLGITVYIQSSTFLALRWEDGELNIKRMFPTRDLRLAPSEIERLWMVRFPSSSHGGEYEIRLRTTSGRYLASNARLIPTQAVGVYRRLSEIMGGDLELYVFVERDTVFVPPSDPTHLGNL